jgi:hypothetical protein
MSNIKRAIESIIECESCSGQGWHFYGDDEMWDVESCDCNPHSIDIEEIEDYKLRMGMDAYRNLMEE